MDKTRPENHARSLDGHGHVGIGTMVVFAATVVIAAIAAGVLIDTAGKLQRAEPSDEDLAKEEVGPALVFDSIIASRDAAEDTLRTMTIYLAVPDGASEMDLASSTLTIGNGTAHASLRPGPEHAAGRFVASPVRDTDASFALGDGTVNAGDLVKIEVDLRIDHGAPLFFGPAEQLDVSFQLGSGEPVHVHLTTPHSFGDDTVVSLA